MTLLEQCQIWNDRCEYKKIVDAIEALPEGERTPELDSELARAYNNLAGPEDRALFEKALALLRPHEAYFQGDYYWNFRMGYSYYYLDQEGPALRHFEQALAARPGDRDARDFVDNCRKCLALPRFRENFRQRAEKMWKGFLEGEEELRRLIDGQRDRDVSQALTARCAALLAPALPEAAFELGFNGEKYELILSPEGDRARLFPLVYLQKRAPAGLLERWNILVGRQPAAGFGLRMDGWEIRAEEVRVWVEKQGEEGAALTLWCEKLLPLLRADEERAWSILSILTDQVLGEVNAIAHIQGFQVAQDPPAGPGRPLAELPQALKDLGMTLWRDAEDFLENGYLAYRLDPVEDPDADWRLDVYTGSTRLPALVNDYLAGESGTADAFHRDGIAPGFLCYPLDSFSGEDRAERLLDFRDALQAAILEKAGREAVTFLGGATGLSCGYLDLLAWDLPAVLEAAADHFRAGGLEWAAYRAFRRDVGAVRLMDRAAEKEPEVDPETGSLLSQADIDAMEAMVEGPSGYYGRMLDHLVRFIQAGVEAGRFTLAQARRDLQVALWYSYACNNLNEYEYYYRAAQWMPDSEENAAGCGMWYYRYSCALMYCGRLEEARDYAERGLAEEPDYPWGWLQAGKLRAYFGDRTGALEAVERGLALEPGDYEFLTLRQEICQGASLEQMEYHWIDPGCDERLQAGQDEGAAEKMQAIACITTDPEGLRRFHALFRPEEEDYERDAPYCSFHRTVGERKVEVVFRMNEAGLSKLDGDWLRAQRERLDSGQWLTLPQEVGPEGVLESVFFGLDRRTALFYRAGRRQLQLWLDADGEPEGPAVELDDEEDGPTEQYTQEEMAAVEEHIAGHFGPVEKVFHELVSPDIHVDICVVEPSETRGYYTLVTMGMGAHCMHVPEELAGHRLDRAELAVALPPDWRPEGDGMEEGQYWPIRLLKTLARLPIACDTWLGWGHTMDNQQPFAPDTELCGALLIAPQGAEEGAETCVLPGGEEVNFYQVIPIYRNEMEYAQRHGAEALLEQMTGVSFVVDPRRPDALEGEEPEDEGTDAEGWVLDDAGAHLECLRKKKLPVDELAACSHMAIYLRWCMEQDLMSLEFLERCWDTMEEFRSDPEGTDLRPFIRDELGGRLFSALFDEEGEAFARAYYGDGDPCYPSDVDAHALAYFGPERYHSDEFQDEAYLFVPFDEDYYQAMARVIQSRWDQWKSGPGGR